MKTIGRPSLNLTPEEQYARKIKQAYEAKQKRKALRAVLSGEGKVLCKEPWCIRDATENRLCEYHAHPESRPAKQQKCLHCDGIAMPNSRLCGYHDETIAERRNETRRKNRAAKEAKWAQIVADSKQEAA